MGRKTVGTPVCFLTGSGGNGSNGRSGGNGRSGKVSLRAGHLRP